jgi:hypothetical protein
MEQSNGAVQGRVDLSEAFGPRGFDLRELVGW